MIDAYPSHLECTITSLKITRSLPYICLSIRIRHWFTMGQSYSHWTHTCGHLHPSRYGSTPTCCNYSMS